MDSSNPTQHKSLLKKQLEKLQNRKQLKKNNLAKKLFPNERQIIKYAFSVKGTDYFQYDDVFALPYERGLMAVAFYNEVNMRCSREYLLKHTETIDKILHESNKIDVFAIDVLNKQMVERLNMIIDVELLYKLASVVFFDKNENPCIYEYEYNQKKIKFWQENKGVSDFFYTREIQELIPFLKSAEVDLDMYFPLNQELNKIHSEKVSTLSNKI